VLLHTKVIRVLFDSNDGQHDADGPTASGVLLSNPAFGEVKAFIRKGGEIFLSAGALESPKILLHSGIGDQSDLHKVGVEVMHHLPEVGRNLIDRKEFQLGVPINGKLGTDTGGILDVAMLTPDVWMSKVPKDSLPWGNTFTLALFQPGDRKYDCFRELLGALLLRGKGSFPESSRNLAIMYLAQRHPTARGTIKLASKDPGADAVIHDGWDSPQGQFDLEVIVNNTIKHLFPLFLGTSFLHRIGHPPGNSSSLHPETLQSLAMIQDSLRDFDSQTDACPSINPHLLQSCSSLSECMPTLPVLPRSHEQLRKVIRSVICSSYHPMGTAAVGQVVEPGTFKVRGVQGLRVVDLSVVTVPVDIHPMMTAMAFGHIIGLSVTPLQELSGERIPVISGIVFASLACIFTFLVLMWVGIAIGRSVLRQPETKGCRDSSFALSSLEHAESFWSHASQKRNHRQVENKPSLEHSESFWSHTSQRKRLQVDGAQRNLAEEGQAGETVAISVTAPDISMIDSCDQGNNRWATEETQNSDAKVCSSSGTPALAWKDLGVTYKQRAFLHISESVVLHGVTGEVFAGEIMAVMGPSGAGKSTLVDILAGCKSLGVLSGMIACEGQATQASQAAAQLQCCCTYVPQETPLMPMQTAE